MFRLDKLFIPPWTRILIIGIYFSLVCNFFLLFFNDKFLWLPSLDNSRAITRSINTRRYFFFANKKNFFSFSLCTFFFFKTISELAIYCCLILMLDNVHLGLYQMTAVYIKLHATHWTRTERIFLAVSREIFTLLPIPTTEKLCILTCNRPAFNERRPTIDGERGKQKTHEQY